LFLQANVGQNYYAAPTKKWMCQNREREPPGGDAATNPVAPAPGSDLPRHAIRILASSAYSIQLKVLSPGGSIHLSAFSHYTCFHVAGIEISLLHYVIQCFTRTGAQRVHDGKRRLNYRYVLLGPALRFFRQFTK